MNTTEKLLSELNDIRGLTYPMVGYTLYRDVIGDGVYKPRIYTIVNEGGGVAYSGLNKGTARKRCDAIRLAIDEANIEAYGVTLAHDPDRPWFND